MSTTDTKLGGVATVAAVAVLAAWLTFLTIMTRHTNAQEVEWARLTAILGSLEAVAFGAAGALFGVTIQRQRVQDAKEHAAKADQRAADADKKADEHSTAAANGKALATAIKARAKPAAPHDTLERMSAVRPQTPDDDLVALARQLFPD
jgi:hypothetical protein